MLSRSVGEISHQLIPRVHAVTPCDWRCDRATQSLQGCSGPGSCFALTAAFPQLNRNTEYECIASTTLACTAQMSVVDFLD